MLIPPYPMAAPRSRTATERDTPTHDAGGRATLDPLLARYTRLLDDASVEYWVEAGTLLSLVRDGRLFSHDKDMDIGVFSDDLDRLGSFLEKARARGQRVARETYKGRPFKFKVYPGKKETGRVLDIQVYRKQAENAWSVVHTIGNYDYKWYTLHRFARGALRWPFRMYLAHRADDVETTSFPWSRMGWLGSWVIPLGMVEKTHRKNPYSLPYPHETEPYLSYRYGNWQTPRSGWIYWEHDGAYRQGPPEKNLP